MEKIDPWGVSQIKNYQAMREQFGIDQFNFNLEGNRFSERSLLVGHRDFQLIKRAMERKEKFYAMTGLMPSGEMHLGNKAVMEMMIHFQRKGAELHIAVADLESYVTRDVDLESAKNIAIENFLLNYIASGDASALNFRLAPHRFRCTFSGRFSSVINGSFEVVMVLMTLKSERFSFFPGPGIYMCLRKTHGLVVLYL